MAVVGIGNELRGDDTAGPLVIRALVERQTHDTARPALLALDAGAAPENMTGALRRFAPDLVIFVDAAFADDGAPPGTIEWIDWRLTTGLSATAFAGSTHTLPLYVIAQYLVAELGCEVALIGIQAGSVTFDHAASPVTQEAVREVAAGLWAAVTVARPDSTGSPI